MHLGFGEAGLPVLPSLVAALADAGGDGRYGELGGSPELRERICGFLGRRNVAATPETVIVGPGSKACLYALGLALGGDIVVTAPAYVSYGGQARLRGSAVVRVPTPPDLGGLPDPVLLRDAVLDARQAGREPKLLFITNPDNPTGTLAGREHLAAVLQIARELGLWVVSDEIYQDLAHEPGSFVSAAAIDPDNVFVTGGLSKSLALGGWRVGHVRAPQTEFGETVAERVKSIGGEVWSCLSAPIATAVELAYSDAPDIVDYIDRARTLHAEVVRGALDVVIAAGATARPPGGGFYIYPDFTDFAEPLARQGITTGSQLSAALLDRFGVLVIAGSAFGDDEAALRFRVATSMLYGATSDERWEALGAAERGRALALPRIRTALDHFASALHELTT